jgi:hypothetical protein
MDEDTIRLHSVSDLTLITCMDQWPQCAGNPQKWVHEGNKNSRATRISSQEWEKHKDILCQLYEKHTLTVVRRIMSRQYGFEPRYALSTHHSSYSLANG